MKISSSGLPVPPPGGGESSLVPSVVMFPGVSSSLTVGVCVGDVGGRGAAALLRVGYIIITGYYIISG